MESRTVVLDALRGLNGRATLGDVTAATGLSREQADQSLARSQGGLGIGLSLARRLVEQHGGRITVHSRGLGQGSEFVVYLPVTAEEARAPRAQPDSGTYPSIASPTSDTPRYSDTT